MQRVCFDHLSGTPMDPEVRAAMEPWFVRQFAGTGAVHSGGVAARTALDEARQKTARFLNASSPEEIIFTSGGTESVNLAIKGCALANQRRGKKIILSAIEHPAVLQSVEFLESLGFKPVRIPVSKVGKINPAAIRDAMDDETILVCAHAGNHDVGTVQDLKAIGDVVAERGLDFFVDASYAAGWLELDVQAVGASYLAMAPHRFHGPKGVGVLFKRRRARLTPLIHGGAQELGWRAGTENIAGIVGTGVACEVVTRHWGRRIQSVSHIQASMWKGLARALSQVRFNGPEPGPDRLPNSINMSVAGIEGEGLALSLDMKGFAITSGQACATKATRVPATLAAMGVPEEFGPGTVILSFGEENTLEEVERFVKTTVDVVKKLRAVE